MYLETKWDLQVKTSGGTKVVSYVRDLRGHGAPGSGPACFLRYCAKCHASFDNIVPEPRFGTCLLISAKLTATFLLICPENKNRPSFLFYHSSQSLVSKCSYRRIEDSFWVFPGRWEGSLCEEQKVTQDKENICSARHARPDDIEQNHKQQSTTDLINRKGIGRRQ